MKMSRVDSLLDPGLRTGSDRHARGLKTGKLVALTADGGDPLIVYPGQPGSSAIVARTTVSLDSSHIGSEIVLAFGDDDSTRPIVLGCIRRSAMESRPPVATAEIEVDDRRIVVSASEQLVLRCGKATITMTSAGKILVQGTYISTKSSGVHRIKGGSVQIN
jgi:hypothetical protein